jgi:hypothetical protein
LHLCLNRSSFASPTTTRRRSRIYRKSSSMVPYPAKNALAHQTLARTSCSKPTPH